MDTIYIRRCLNGKTFVAAADPSFSGLKGQKCPFTGEDFENVIKDVDRDKAEVMGINFDEAAAGVQKDGLFFGKFKVNLSETMVMQ